MRDLRVVELVENVLVEVLGIEPDEVVPFAVVCDDLGAGPAQLRQILWRLGQQPSPRQGPGAQAGGARRPLTVEDLVDWVEADLRQAATAEPPELAIGA